MLLTVAQLGPKATSEPHFEIFVSVHTHIKKHIFNS